MSKLTLASITNWINPTATYDANNALIEAAIENTLSRDGTAPNTMSAPLDMNSQDINNVGTLGTVNVNASGDITTDNLTVADTLTTQEWIVNGVTVSTTLSNAASSASASAASALAAAQSAAAAAAVAAELVEAAGTLDGISDVDAATPIDNQVLTFNSVTGHWNAETPITDHGGLTGLADDDHTQYHTDARGDARYSQLAHNHAGVYEPADVTILKDADIGVTVQAYNANIQSHIASTSNPHTVTKAQVGLTNVSDDAQLKIASNLSDLNNAATARTNLGLGTLATQSGTFSGTSSGTNTGDQVVPAINKIINGNFDIWQRDTSQTSSGYGSDDRWYNSHSGSTKTASRQAFTLGQTDVPYEPTYYSRTVVTSVAGAGNFVTKQQKIENVRTFAGQTATLSFYAKADASKNMAVEFIQNFGTGGSPSAEVTAVGVTTCALTTSWQKFTTTVAIPSISGKTLGTNNNAALLVLFWFDAGSTYNSRTNSLGQQSGTFDIAQAQLESGSTANPFVQRSIGEELALCQRYYEKSFNLTVAPAQGSGNYAGAIVYRTQIAGTTAGYIVHVPFAVTKRGVPTMTGYSPASANATWRNVSVGDSGVCNFSPDGAGTGEHGFLVLNPQTAGDGVGQNLYLHWAAEAEL